MIVSSEQHIENYGTCSDVQIISADTSEVMLSVKDVFKVGVIVVNDSPNVMYVKYNPGVTVTTYTWKLRKDDILIVDDFRGDIVGLWSGAVGQAIVTEYFK